VWKGHPEQHADTSSHCRRHGRARQPRAQLSAALERRAKPELLVIRRNHQTGQVSLDPLRWGLVPYWCEDPKGGRKPINAKCETVHKLADFSRRLGASPFFVLDAAASRESRVL
jgi:putative SOS response-associated peptidase YedK